MVIGLNPVGVIGSGQSVKKFSSIFVATFLYYSVLFGIFCTIFGHFWFCSGVVGNVVCEKSFQELFSLTYNTDGAAAREI